MDKKRLMKWFGTFFAAMFLFTVVSRAADSVNVAQIQTKTVQNQVITHEVKGSGKVEGTRECAVFAKEGQLVERIFVHDGDAVKKGDVLFQLSGTRLKKTIKEKEDEIRELTLKVQDLQSAASVDGKKKSYARNRAGENYNTAVRNGDIRVANAWQEAEAARRKLAEYYASRTEEFTDGTEDRSQEQALKDDIRMKEEAVTQARMERDESVRASAREIEDARMGDPSDGTLENVQRELKKSENELKMLQKIKKRKGKITSPVNGVIKNICVSTGGSTTEEAAVVLYETKGSLRLEGTVEKTDLKYIKTGGAVTVTGNSTKEEIHGIIRSVKEDETDVNQRIVSIEIPEGALAMGESAEFTVTEESGPYDTCVPLSALGEESGRYFVYVVENKDTVLGEVPTARMVSVNVKDKNLTFVALEPGTLTNTQKIIVYSDREITDGSRVRLQEN